MDKREAIELLKQAITEIGHLKELPYNTQEYHLWRNKLKDLIKAKLDEDDWITFVSAYNTSVIRDSSQEDYIENLNRLETAVKSIIQKYEILGIEEKPRNIKYPKPGQRYQTREVEKAPAALVETPIHIFDRMQFHSKVVEASRQLFKDGHYRDAIYRAFVEVNNYVKDKSNKQLDGKKLMSTVFNLDNPIIKLNSLRTQSDKDEQEGFMFLFMGAMEGIRNPKAHENIIQNDPYRTLEYLGLASLLMRIAEQGAAVKTRATRINEEIFLARCREGGHERAIDLYLKAKALEEERIANGDFINWGVSGYSYRMPWKDCVNGGTIFTAFSNGKLQIWPDIILRKSSAGAGNKYLEKLRSVPRLAKEFSIVSKHKYPTISTEMMSEPEIDTFIEAIKELGINLDEISKEPPN